MEFFRLPGQFRSHMEQYEKDKKEESRRYRQQLTETTKQINRLNKHIITTKVKFEKVQENIDLMGKEIKKEFSEEIKGINTKIEDLKEEVKNDLKQNKNDIKKDLKDTTMEIQKYVVTELNRSDAAMDELEKKSRQQKQKFDNYRQQTNKRLNKVESQVDKLYDDNRSLLSMLKCLIMGNYEQKLKDTLNNKLNDPADNSSIMDNEDIDINKSFANSIRFSDSVFSSKNHSNNIPSMCNSSTSFSLLKNNNPVPKSDLNDDKNI